MPIEIQKAVLSRPGHRSNAYPVDVVSSVAAAGTTQSVTLGARTYPTTPSAESSTDGAAAAHRNGATSVGSPPLSEKSASTRRVV